MVDLGRHLTARLLLIASLFKEQIPQQTHTLSSTPIKMLDRIHKFQNIIRLKIIIFWPVLVFYFILQIIRIGSVPLIQSCNIKVGLQINLL